MGLVKLVVRIVGIAILLVIGIAAFLYFTDYAAHATITQRGSDSSGDFVVVTPSLVPAFHYKMVLDSQYWNFVCQGYSVDFHVQTHAYTVHDKQGNVVYDSKTPPDPAQLVASRVRC